MRPFLQNPITQETLNNQNAELFHCTSSKRYSLCSCLCLCWLSLNHFHNSEWCFSDVSTHTKTICINLNDIRVATYLSVVKQHRILSHINANHDLQPKLLRTITKRESNWLASALSIKMVYSSPTMLNELAKKKIHKDVLAIRNFTFLKQVTVLYKK